MTARLTGIFLLPFACIIGNPNARGEIKLPNSEVVKNVDFERHLMGLFSKAGCNNGSCHGSFQGKNGFRLSLFGLEPDKDYAALTRDLQGRRVDPINPDNSLLLLKATGTMSHDGGVKFSRDSWQYALIREWIRDGMPRRKGSGELAGIEISPKDQLSLKPGEKARITVKANFADGSSEDVTPFCDFRIQDDAVARVTPAGEISAHRPGDTGFVALYRGQVAALRVLAPTKATADYPSVPAVNYVDTEVFAKLKLLNVVPSELSKDAEFLRRVTIDTTGSLPTPDEVRQFLADQSPDKRARKIDELLKNPRHAALWATKFSDITGNNTLALEQPQNLTYLKSQQWHDWFRSRIEQNMPYDEIVKGVMTATSREGKNSEEWLAQVKKIEEQGSKFDTSEYSSRKTLDMFWRRQAQVPSIEWGEKVAAAFLGVRLECAQCHKHPTDRWTQADYRAFANVFSNITFVNNQFSSPELKKIVETENADRTSKVDQKNRNQLSLVREMFVQADQPKGRNAFLTHPDTNQPLKPKAIAGPEFTFAKGKDIRAELFEWMRSPENPFFAKSFVNRVWAHYFGVGIVDPVDDFSLANPPSNARLLEALAKDFIDGKYDVRRLERTILMSRTYQNSSTPNETNRFDKNNFARSYVRPMMAEVVVDIVNDAIGATESFGNEIPAGKRMIEIGSSRINNSNVAYALRIFGRPARTTACDCERAMEPALPQTLFRMTDPSILQKLKGPTTRFNGLLKDRKKSDEAIFEEVFLAALGRFPTAGELDTFHQHRLTNTDRSAAFTDVVWALINTREFILNH